MAKLDFGHVCESDTLQCRKSLNRLDRIDHADAYPGNYAPALAVAAPFTYALPHLIYPVGDSSNSTTGRTLSRSATSGGNYGLMDPGILVFEQTAPGALAPPVHIPSSIPVLSAVVAICIAPLRPLIPNIDQTF